MRAIPSNHKYGVKALVSSEWLVTLLASRKIPEVFLNYSNPSDIEALLKEEKSPFDSEWTLLTIESFDRKCDTHRCSNLPPVQDLPEDEPSFAEILSYVSQSNFVNMWRDAYKQYQKPYDSVSSSNCQEKGSSFEAILLEGLYRLYGDIPCLYDTQETHETFSINKDEGCPNILPALAIIVEDEAIHLLKPSKHVSLHQALTFSPSFFTTSSHLKLFVLYQILLAFKHVHSKGLTVGDVSLDDISITNEGYVMVNPKVRLNVVPLTQNLEKDNKLQASKEKLHEIEAAMRENQPHGHLLDDIMVEVINEWKVGKISNFDYIMCLNYFAGRNFSNPNHYPVYPWISDFSSKDSGWRDLTKSKFRLNKGDPQLDLTYSSEHIATCQDLHQSQQVQAPHHVSDILSEITYYVYKARRTPRTILCKFVRNRWVPAEYPLSMQRMFSWTPDECIPEFYTDPTIFKSIHDDLSDLEIPDWCANAEEFVVWHRDALESREVSENLHHWIDLTFGFKLSGASAVRSKNVVLGLVDNHKDLRTSGVVQLFTEPHPPRGVESYYWSKDAPLIDVSFVTSSSFDGDESDFMSEGDRTKSRSRLSLTDAALPVEEVKKISLPGHFDPLFKLQSLESYQKFLLSFNSRSESSSVLGHETASSYKVLVHNRIVSDMQVLGILVLELWQPESFCHLGRDASQVARFETCKNLLERNDLATLPLSLKLAAKALLLNDFKLQLSDRYQSIDDHGLPPPSAFQFLTPQLSALHFPKLFQPFSKTLGQIYDIELTAEIYQPKKDHSSVGEFIVKYVSAELLPAMSDANIDELNLVVPFILTLLKRKETAITAAWYLFEPVAKLMGSKTASHHFLIPLIDIYENSTQTSKHLKLYHRNFLQFLIVRVGTLNFLKYFSTYLIEAVGGYKDYDDDSTRAPREGLEKSWRTSESSTRPGSRLSNREEVAARPGSQSSNPNSHEEESFAEGDIFSFDSTSLNEIDYTMVDCKDVAKEDKEDIYIPPMPFKTQNDAYDLIQMASEHLRQKKNSGNISQVASESVIWLAHRVGPVLTSRHLIRNLLRMLNLCYVDPESFLVIPDKFPDQILRLSTCKVQGDCQVLNVLDCLSDLVCLNGRHIILLQYIPYAWDLLAMAKKKLTVNLEGGLVGIMAMLHKILPLLSDSDLMKELPDGILSNILMPTLQIFASRSIPFSGGLALRRNLSYKFLDTVYLIGLRIGEEMCRSVLIPVSTALFSSFDKVYDREGQRLEIAGESMESKQVAAELQRVLSPEYAYASYLAFYNLMGRNHLETSIVNLDLIKTLCLLQQKSGDMINRPATFHCLRGEAENATASTSSASLSSGGNKVNSSTGGNSLIPQGAGDQSITSPVTSANDLHFLIAKDINTSSGRHLKGNWLAYWEHETGKPEKDTKFNLKQVKLQSFVGHNAAVKSMFVLENENSFLSGSRDKTVKVWSIRNNGDGTFNNGCQWTYSLHKKSVFSVNFLESQRLAVSCDTSIHVWDPFIGSGVHQVDGQRIGAIHAMTHLSPPSPVLVGATQDSMLHLIDCRMGNIATSLKVAFGSTGLVRSLGHLQTEVLVGHSSGYISVISLRTGRLRQAWKAHEGEILNLTLLDKSEFLSCSLDQTVSTWNSGDGKLKHSLPGAQEPVHCVTFFEPTCSSSSGTIVTGTTANRIGIRHGTTPDSSFQSTKLRSDIVKGNLTSLAGLPMNHLLLMGQDNGSISLLN